MQAFFLLYNFSTKCFKWKPHALIILSQAKQVNLVFPREDGPEGLKKALTRICEESAEAASSGHKMIILTDRKAGEKHVPVR